MYCGAGGPSGPIPGVEIDPEWDVLELLAREYNCTTSKIEKAMSIWQEEVLEAHASHKKAPTFHVFMTGQS
jgi:hypothetical protein